SLLLTGTNWLQLEPQITLQLGSTTISTPQNGTAEAGTGYFKTVIAGEQAKPAMGNIQASLSLPKDQQAQAAQLTTWGALYWQYFENLDAITAANTGLKIEKTLYLKKTGSRGPELVPLTEGATLQVGNKVTMRLVITTDRNLEYVHFKDLRASGFEPTEALSGYKYRDGLGYYQMVRDAAMHYFIGYLPRGTHVLEYDVVATHAGSFSNGISTLQCMYAPEFSSHSQGIRVTIEPLP
ncbi:MAG TPA: alpha-2-macroglobulin, partial [Phnomibacter sp.]|nr:alpha-2-macroglobulin [Phnomibacter sp.]